VLTDEQRDSALGDLVELSLVTPKEKNLERINVAVTCLTLGVGICLLAGFCTRFASLAGATFLLSIMVTQPPWALGARTEFFYYQ